MWGDGVNPPSPATKHPVDQRPIYKLEFDPCGPVEKNPRVLYMSRFNLEHFFSKQEN